MIQSRRVELNKFHILHQSLSTIDHRYTITRRNRRVGGCLVNITDTTRRNHCHLSKEGMYMVCTNIQYISAITLNVRCSMFHQLSEMMLGNDFNGKMLVEYINVRMFLYCFNQAVLNLFTCIILMMKDTEIRVTTLLVKVKITLLILIEIDAPLQ